MRAGARPVSQWKGKSLRVVNIKKKNKKKTKNQTEYL